MKKPRWVEALGLSFASGAVVILAGLILDSLRVIATGALLMAPLFIGISMALSSMAAESCQQFVETGIGKGLISKTVYWAVFLLVAAGFLLAGPAEYVGPRFWGSID